MVIPIEGPALVGAGGAIQLLLIQPPAPDVDEVQADRPRGEALAMLTAVLDPTGAPMRHVGRRTAVVLVPELAFASSELPRVRALLDGCGKKVVLVAGFGLARQTDLQAWIDQGSADAITVVTPLEDDLSDPNARINGAWVLVNQPGVGVFGWAHVKTFPEQSVEKFHFESAPGTTLPLITLGAGLTLAPLICSELLQDDHSGQQPSNFAAKALADRINVRADERVLVATLSWQDKPADERWIVGLNRLFHEPRVRPRLRVATVNYEMDKDDDDRRSLVGVFRDAAEARSATAGRFHRRVRPGRVMASLLRTSSRGVSAGPLVWGADATQSNVDAWAVSWSWHWDGVALVQRNPVDAHAVEIGRALARVPLRGNPVEQTRCEALAHEAQHFSGLISSLWAETARDGLAGNFAGLEPDTLAPTLRADAALVQAAEVTAVLPRDKDGIMEQRLPIGDGSAFARRRVVPLIGRADVALVWYSDRLTAEQQYAQLVKIVASLGTSDPLVVVGGSTLRGKRPATGLVAEGSLVRAGHEVENIMLPRSGVAAWLSADDLVGAVAASCNEPALIAAVQRLIDRALSTDDSTGGAL